MKLAIRRTTWTGSTVSLFSLVFLGVSLVSLTGQRPVWVTGAAVLALAAWLVRVLLGYIGTRWCWLAEPFMVLFGAGVAAPTHVISLIPACVAVLLAIAEVGRPLWHGLTLAAASVILIAAGGVYFGSDIVEVLGLECGVAIAALVGVSRRQLRSSDAQREQLRLQAASMREEEARVELMQARQTVSRDIHDVLAHSLGGLVIQLDAVEAVLEAGDVERARGLVADSRRLAADGLADARRAVAALRDEDTGGPPPSVAEFGGEVRALVDVHRSLGGSVDFIETGEPFELAADRAAALRRALQESLSNARKHAPRQPVRVTLDWSSELVRLEVRNPVIVASGEGRALAASGGGHGLRGMRERFDRIAGARATAGLDGQFFVVDAEVPVP